MARRRLGVALVLDPPPADEVDGLRRALGDRALTRIPPHLTLISPVNVRPDDLNAVLGLLRDAAASAAGPLRLPLGPPRTFLPDNPVLYLAVGGDPTELARIRQILFTGPLARSRTWPWVPHVTLADEAEPDRIRAAIAALDRFRLTATFDRVVLLEEQRLPPPLAEDRPEAETTARRGAESTADEVTAPPSRHWVPVADAALGPRAVVGQGGLPLELTSGRLLDPQALALLLALPELRAGANPWTDLITSGVELDAASAGESWPARSSPQDPFPLVVVARREGEVVGVAAAWYLERRGYLGVAVDAGCRLQGIGAQILGRLESLLAEAGWNGPALEGVGDPSFYVRSRTAR